MYSNRVMHSHLTPAFEEPMQSPIEQLASEMFPKTVFVSVVKVVKLFLNIYLYVICSLHSRNYTQTDRSWC